ncbi:MAG: FUN14 domain-containing protein [Halodesulfurarchaeum sp.]
MAFEFDFAQLGLEFGSGAVIGAIIGFAFKKVAKIIAILVGLELALFRFLESRGILAVDWSRLTGGLVKATEGISTGTPPSWIQTILSTLSISVGFTGGFLLGFKRG